MVAAPAGASSQWPFSGPPSSAAQQAPLSNRGQQSQSMEPDFDTNAAERQSPRMP
jgi:hypothetical protein